MLEIKDIDYQKYIGKYGERAKKNLSTAGKNQQLLNAMNTPVGLEFLRRLGERFESNQKKYNKMDVDSSNNKFVEMKSRLNESEEILIDFMKVLDDQEQLINKIIKEAM